MVDRRRLSDPSITSFPLAMGPEDLIRRSKHEREKERDLLKGKTSVDDSNDMEISVEKGNNNDNNRKIELVILDKFGNIGSKKKKELISFLTERERLEKKDHEEFNLKLREAMDNLREAKVKLQNSREKNSILTLIIIFIIVLFFSSFVFSISIINWISKETKKNM
jgi:hypothetical protein